MEVVISQTAYLYFALTLFVFSIIGPNLHGLFGKQYGSTPGFSYSAASKNKEIVWEEKTLYDYLLNPKEVKIAILIGPINSYPHKSVLVPVNRIIKVHLLVALKNTGGIR